MLVKGALDITNREPFYQIWKSSEIQWKNQFVSHSKFLSSHQYEIVHSIDYWCSNLLDSKKKISIKFQLLVDDDYLNDLLSTITAIIMCSFTTMSISFISRVSCQKGPTRHA